MSNVKLIRPAVGVTLLSSLLVACGGGGDSSTGTSTATSTQVTTTTNPTPVTTTPVTSPSAITDTSTTTPAKTEEQVAFNALNSKRVQCGFSPLTYSSELAKSASNHANYLNYVSAQNKTDFASHNEGEMASNGVIIPYTSATTNPYYSGLALKNRVVTDASPLGSKAQAVNYGNGTFNEDLSVMTTNTTASSIDSQVAASAMILGLLSAPYHMQGLLDNSSSQVGIGYQQTNWQNNGYNTFVSTLEIVSALPATMTANKNTQLLNYPCNGMMGTEYQLENESPNPLPSRDLASNPIGQPIYILAPSDKTISTLEATVTTGGVSVGKLNMLTQSTDPNKLLKANEAFILPDVALKPLTTYQVSYTVHYSTGETAQNSFSFTTHSQV